MNARQEQRRFTAARIRQQFTPGTTTDVSLAGAASIPLADSYRERQTRFRWSVVRSQIRSHPVHAASALILVFMVALALAGPLLPLPDAQQQDLISRLQPPMSRGTDGTLHIAGTDQLGRDVLARLIAGARVTLGISLVTVLIAGTIGSLLGLLAGYRGGPVDHLIMRLVDLQMAFPSLLFAMFLLYLLGATIVNLILLLTVLGWIGFTRITRAQTLSIRNQVFVESARAIGCSNGRILLRHILPHMVPVLAVIAVFDFSGIMLAEAGLSYLGLGVQPPDTSWGRMIAEGQQYVYTGGWWLFLFPGGAIFLIVLSARLTSAWIQDMIGHTNGA